MNKNTDIDQWNTYANLYHKGKGSTGDELHKALIQPILNKFLRDYSSSIILDAGCGNGFFTNQLAQRAKKVVGIDISDKLLKHARENIKTENVSLKKADLTKELPFQDDQFDIVISIMVLQYLPQIKKFVSECSRILKPDGKLIVIIDHPSHALFLRAQELVGKKNEKFITSGSYFKSGSRKKHSLWNKAILQYYHRPVGFYLNNFISHFRLVGLEEISSDNEIPRILGLNWLNQKN
ncbi:MAG: class I SAM-dependent methyltransferase [bacterium]